MIAIILAAAALVVAAIALVISMKKQKSIPFTFDKKKMCIPLMVIWR